MLQNYRSKSLSGPINVCSPFPETNDVFTRAMGNALNRISIIPVPTFAVNLIFGEMGQEMLLGGQRVVPKKLMNAGFEFEDRLMNSAIENFYQTK